jgi:ketosteroid isomerase-like protein
MGSSTSASDFVATFADFWRHPTPDRLPELLHSDVVLIQPLASTTRGIASAQKQFERFRRCLPGLHADIDRWSGNNELIFIEFTLHAHFRREILDWPTVNRLTLKGGKAVERATYFDSLALLPTLLRHPSVWWRWAAS